MKRILAFASIIATSLVLFISNAAYASVGTGDQWNDDYSGSYLNAWNGGMMIKVYNGNAANNDFTYVTEGSAYGLQLTNGNSSDPYEYYCISDYANLSTDAKAALNPCTSPIPWGAVFDTYSCTAGGQTGLEFYNHHWQGWLEATSGQNGAQYYLNGTISSCFVLENPY